MHLETDRFYREQAEDLILRYDKADMSALHASLLHYIPHNSSVLDIGFGSGRDLQFLYDNDYYIWGMDPTANFVENAKHRFSDIPDHFFCDRLPLSNSHLEIKNFFDAVVVIAVWMHLHYDEYSKAVEDLVAFSKPKATIIISYSKGNRDSDDGRYFAEVDQPCLDDLFEQKGYKKIETIASDDSLKRATLQWVTVVYRHD